jgi:hypothetical protein
MVPLRFCIAVDLDVIIGQVASPGSSCAVPVAEGSMMSIWISSEFLAFSRKTGNPGVFADLIQPCAVWNVHADLEMMTSAQE